MDKPTQIKLIAVIAVLAGPFLAIQGHNTKQSLAALEADGVTVEGTIDGGESSSGRRRSTTHSFDVNFTPQAGTAQTKSFKVTEDYFKAHVSGDMISDPKVQVRYLPTDVNTAILVGGSTDNSWTFPAGIGGAIGGLLTALFMFFVYKPAVA